MNRRRLTLLAAAFVAARLVLVMGAADRLSQPDAAEVKLMALGDGWVRDGAPSLDTVLWHVRAGTNAPHGAYLGVSLLYALLVVPFGAEASYLALKLTAILIAALGLVAWTAVAGRLGGPRAAAAMAVLLFVPPPGFLAGSMVAWGSHPESAALVGLAAWALTSGRVVAVADAVVAGLAVGAVVGANLLTGPLVAVIVGGWAWDERRRSTPDRPWGARAAALVGGATVSLGAMLAITGGLAASVTETAGTSPLDLLTGAAGPGLLGATLGGLLPLPLWPIGVADPGAAGVLEWISSGVLLGGLALAIAALRGRADRGVATALLVLGPLAHLATVVLLAPRRPEVPPRYLLVLTPLALLGFALAVAWQWDRGRARTLAVGLAALWAVPCLGQQLGLLEPGRIAQFTDYRPAPWLAADIGRVTYEEAPWVNRFVEARGPDETQGFGFAAGVGASDEPFATDRGEALDPVALMERRGVWLAESRTTAQRRLLHENIGWSLSVFAWQRSGVWHAVLSHLPPGDREATAFGLGIGLGLRGGAGCEAARRMEDAEAILEGARSFGGCR